MISSGGGTGCGIIGTGYPQECPGPTTCDGLLVVSGGEQVLADVWEPRLPPPSPARPDQPAQLIADRAVDMLPSVDTLAETIERQQTDGGRVSDRPHLTDAQIADNLRTYKRQMSPFFDFERAAFRHNSEWLARVALPQLIELLAQIPVSASLQREDFRERLAAGHGLTMAEFMYSVVMALDSYAIAPHVEVGGVDQLLNMQMCRRVMTVSGQTPEIVVTTALIEGTDGTGTKMSKSAENDVPVTSAPDDMYGKVMSIPDRQPPTLDESS